MTLFSLAEHRYPTIDEGEAIPTEPFLLASDEILPFFDVLGATTFRPVKSDMRGNITRLRTKYQSDPEKFKTLQMIVDSEIAEGSNRSGKSCTVGLLWLKRALEFIYEFLQCVLTGEEDLVKCANKAYELTLKKYHGWIVRGIYSLAVRTLPYRKDFIISLKKDPTVTDEQLYEDMKASLTNLKTNLDEINRFYTEKGQHSEDVA